MNIVYVNRSYGTEYRKFRSYSIRDFSSGLKQIVKSAAYGVRRNICFSEIDGFFEGSLHQAGKVTRVSNSKISKQSLSGKDALVVNFRCVPGKLRGDYSRLIQIAKWFHGTKALFIDADKAQIMPDDSILDHYDVVFKREPFLDLDRYPISYANKLKIRPTMLSCRYFTHSAYNVFSKQRHKDLLSQKPPEKQSDVFFIGKASDERVEAWTALTAIQGLKISGGLLPRKGVSLDSKLTTTPVSEVNFIRNLQRARINLAIDGHGEFTFRHLEVWCAGGFLLAHANLRDIWLPLSMQEHEHFECYENTDDLMDKIKYFLGNPDECSRISLNGRKIFQQEYSTHHHGKEIRKFLIA